MYLTRIGCRIRLSLCKEPQIYQFRSEPLIMVVMMLMMVVKVMMMMVMLMVIWWLLY